MYNTALSYLQNIQDAEEITQDVFVSIFEKAHTFRNNSKVSTWIYRIAINKSLNLIDKRSRRPKAQSLIQDDARIEFHHPGIVLENKEKATILFATIDTLSENQKTAFILSYIEGLPRKEVAEIMETSLKSVESLLQRSKTNLRKKLISIYPKGNI